MGSVIHLEAWSHPSSWGPLVPPIVGLQQTSVSAVPTQLADTPSAGMRPIKNKNPMKAGKRKRGISRRGFNMGWYFLYWQRVVSWDTASSAEGARTFFHFLQCAGQQQISVVPSTAVW